VLTMAAAPPTANWRPCCLSGRHCCLLARGVLALWGIPLRLDAVHGDFRRAPPAAVSVAFCAVFSILAPGISRTSYLIPPNHISSGYAVVAGYRATGVGSHIIVLLTWTNSRGLQTAKSCKHFTSAKTWRWPALILAGLFSGVELRRGPM